MEPNLMLLPDIEILPKWLGHRSLGSLLLDKDLHDREVNAREHKILKDLLSGKKVSMRRLQVLLDGIKRKWQPGQILDHVGLEQIMTVSQCRDTAYIQVERKEQLTICFWTVLAQILLEEKTKTRYLCEGLTAKSGELFALYQEGSCQSLAVELRGLAAQLPAENAQVSFLLEMAALFSSGKEEQGRVELAAFGALMLMAVFLHKDEEAEDIFLERLSSLFVTQNHRVDPRMSVANWLARLEQRTCYPKDKLLWDGFVRLTSTDEASEELDVRNLLRNPRRYRTGELVPSFHKVQELLKALRPKLDSKEYEEWRSELEAREFGAFFVLLVTNSASMIEAVGGDPNRPSQTVFDLIHQRSEGMVPN